MVALTVTLGVLIVFAVILAGTFVGVQYLRRDSEGTTAYRVFLRGYPVGAVMLLFGLAVVLETTMQFDPVAVLGVTVASTTLRWLGLASLVGGFVGCLCTLLVVGIGLDVARARATE